MSAGIILPQQFAYPAAAIVSTFWLTAFQTINVGNKRRASGIKYPQLYAEKAEAEASKEANIFNCAQRAHQNTLEYLPAVITSTLITSLKHPILGASLCGAWTAARFFYTIGYSTGDPTKRNWLGSAVISTLGWLGLVLGSTWSAAQLVSEAL
ncbi:hypothetical protein AcV5_005164 [Taiwanofungus camphoratus]|nr:hypothetical protein AcW2_000241 [Antrodia cinnamomea]KAI0937212.1 hypothetical protein AcV5_005164 [Antrodia cinnamomea]KAI0962424.1 hypothetical protein AcV7_001268 [Antrodia cinnamomea]